MQGSNSDKPRKGSDSGKSGTKAQFRRMDAQEDQKNVSGNNSMDDYTAPEKNVEEAQKLARKSANPPDIDDAAVAADDLARAKTYGSIIENQNENALKRHKQNMRFKAVMFWICIAVLAVSLLVWACVVLGVMKKTLSGNILDIIHMKCMMTSILALLASAILPFITSFLALPHTIITNLFDHTEDKQFENVLGQFLSFDSSKKKKGK